MNTLASSPSRQAFKASRDGLPNAMRSAATKKPRNTKTTRSPRKRGLVSRLLGTDRFDD